MADEILNPQPEEQITPPETQEQETTTKKAKSNRAGKTESYVVGCKLPAGLRIGEGANRVELKGANHSSLINGFGLTSGVPADVWDAFEKAHKNHPLIRNGIVFAVSDETSARDAALERAGVKTGLEQANAAAAGVEDLKED
ncbi:hypothetical protein [Pantoea ananatis]|uniref:hypothetical protein n=1 Tax=Pantoea ananas TaxID=553 RepID=UPI000232339D|nr:hypothetical protein [Pantoea ananatis]AER33603.1 hypothetical protein PAGR_g3111 [Pantoea ananatis PA13]